LELSHRLTILLEKRRRGAIRAAFIFPTRREIPVAIPRIPLGLPARTVDLAGTACGHFPAMLLAHAFIALGLTAIDRRDREAGKGCIGQGVRFGILMAILSVIPGYLIY
jgi:hypothetical protein